MSFQSTLSVRRATVRSEVGTPSGAISIHALREESDTVGIQTRPEHTAISIHALREESDVLSFIPSPSP